MGTCKLTYAEESSWSFSPGVPRRVQNLLFYFALQTIISIFNHAAVSNTSRLSSLTFVYVCLRVNPIGRE